MRSMKSALKGAFLFYIYNNIIMLTNKESPPNGIIF